jgi:ABC-type Co2+ transport system permease subunit
VKGVGQRVRRLPPRTRRIVVTILAALLFVAAAFIVPVPGPFSVLLVLTGLTVLSWEFEWAKKLRSRACAKFDELKSKRNE